MGLDNPIHLMFLLVVLLLVFGAKRLPELGHSLGTGLRGFKEAIGGEDTHSALSAMTQEHSHTPAPVASVPTSAPVVASVPTSAPVVASVPAPASVASVPVPAPVVASKSDDRVA